MSDLRDPASRVRGTISAPLLLAWIAAGEAANVATPELYRATGAAPQALNDPEARIALEGMFRLIELVMRAGDDPSVPERLAEQARIERLHVMGFLIMTSVIGRDAVMRAIRYSSFITDSGHWSMHEHDDAVEIRWHREGVRTLGHRVENEMLIGSFVHTMRAVSGDDFACTRVSFRHAAPRDIVAHRRFFRGPVEFSGEHDSFWFPPPVSSASRVSPTPTSTRS